MNDELLTVTQVLEYVPVSRQTLYKLFQRGEGPPFLKIGSRKFVRKSDLAEWLNSRQRSGGVDGQR